MTVLEQYTEILERIKSDDNKEKYHHLYSSENNSPNEEMINRMIQRGELTEKSAKNLSEDELLILYLEGN